MLSISPCLWFDSDAEQAVDFYVSVFPNSRIIDTTYYLEGMPREAGTVLTVHFELDGTEFEALNGGPVYKITPAVSFIVYCDTQAQIDYYWDTFTAEGEAVQCGWVTDKFGVSWQVVPRMLDDLIRSPDTAAAQRAATAMLGMIKLDITELQRAFDGEGSEA